MTAPRAVGVRTSYVDVPAPVRRWVDETLGSAVTSWSDQAGGMSPGCATRVVTDDGTHAFVKAVGVGLNPDSPTLFRREVDVLRLVGDDRLWAGLRASYDDGDWVALVLEDVPGGHPDLTDDEQMADLVAATDRLVARLAEVELPPAAMARDIAHPGLIDVRARFLDWSRAVDHIADLPADLVPSAVRRRPGLRSLVAPLTHRGESQLLHWDIRVDNLLRPSPGRTVFVDWGAAAAGPPWVDPLLARLERVDQPWFDASVADSPALADLGDDLVTGWLVAFGGYLVWRSTQGVADVGLPTLNEFRRTEGRRFLAAAARRLS